MCVCVCESPSHFQLFVTPWTVAHQAPLSMGFSRQEYWNGQPFPSPGGLLNPRIEPGSPALQVDSLPSKPPGKPENWVLSPNVGFGWLWAPLNGPPSSGPPRHLPPQGGGGPTAFLWVLPAHAGVWGVSWVSASKRHQNAAWCKPFPDNFEEDYT